MKKVFIPLISLLIIITFMISVFLSRKIKKIEVYKLIKE